MRHATLFTLGLLLAAAGCSFDDPVLNEEINALGGEVAGIRQGPAHRAGQPCGLCHSEEGGRHPVFAVAGTIFQKNTNKVGVEGAVVHITDATGTTEEATSNCVGNFYIEEGTWAPTFPLFIVVTYDPYGSDIVMKSKIARDSSCASCHADPVGTDSPGHVYLTNDPTVPDMAPLPPTCGK